MSGEQKILRATEFLWRFWWFCFYIILLPTLCAVAGYYIFPLLFPNPKAPYYGAIFTLLGALAFFSRFFEKYRKRPIFQDNLNIFEAMISGPFILLLLAIVMEPIGTIIARLPGVSEVLTTISLPNIYNLIWIYFYYQFFRWDENAKFTPLYSRANRLFARSLHEIVYFGIYITEILFIAILHDVPFIWLHALAIPLLFFGLIWLTTISERRVLRRALVQNAYNFGFPASHREKKHLVEPKLMSINEVEFEDLTQKYLRKLTRLGITVIFLLLFQFLLESAQINASLIQANPGLGGMYALIFSILGTVFIKVHVDLTLSHKSKRSWSRENRPKIRMLQNLNFFLTTVAICLVFGWSLVASSQLVALGILCVFIFITYFEARGNFYGKFDKPTQMVTWFLLGMEICWGMLPLDWIFQFIAFLLYMYLILDVARRTRFFKKKDIAVVQNLLVTTIIFAVLFAIYPSILEAYLFSNDPAMILVSHSFFVIFFLLVAIIAILYRLFFSLFRKQASSFLKNTLSTSIFVFLCFLVIIIDFRIFNLLDISSFITANLAFMLLIPIAFAVFSTLNLKIGILSQKDCQNYNYYSAWMLSNIIVLFIGVLFPTFIGILADILYVLIVLQVLVHFAVKLQRISEQFRQAFSRVSSYLFVFVSFALFYDVFANQLFLNPLYSIFLALSVMICIAHVLSLVRLFPATLVHFLTILTFYFLPLAVFANSLQWYKDTPYDVVVPLIFAACLFILPNIYALKANVGHAESFRKILKINFQILAILIGVLQISNLFFYLLPGEQVNFISLVSFPFIVYAIMITVFAALGTFTRLYSKQEFGDTCYYAAWPLLPVITLLTLSNNLNIFGFSWGVLFFSLYLQILIYWTNSRKKLNQEFYNKFTTINSIAFVVGVFCVIYGTFSNSLWTSLFAVFLGFCGVCGAALLFTKFFTLYPPKYVKLLTAFTLYFLVFVVLYYSALGFEQGTYLIAIPPLLTASTSFLPHIVTYRLGLIKRGILIKLANLSLLAVAISLGLLSLAAIVTLGTLSAEIMLIYSITLPFITFSAAILLFSPLGKSLGLYTKVDCQHNQYYATWILLPPISLLIVAFWPLFLGHYIGYVLGILFLLISLHFLFRWSIILGKLPTKRFIVAILLNSIIFASIVISIPTIIGLELLRVSLQFPTLEVVSFTSFILLACVSLFETRSSRFQFKPEVTNALKRVELFSWFFVKAVLCLILAIILPLPSIIEKVLVVIILASVLSPITLVYLKKAGMEVRNLRLTIDQLIAIIYTTAMAGLYIISYWPSANGYPIFVTTPILGLALGGCNVFLFLNLSSIAYKRTTTKFQPQLTNDEVPAQDSPVRKWGAFFGVTSALFLLFFFQYPIISPLFLLMTYLVTLTFRNSNSLFRLIQVFLLSFVTYINGLLFINFHANTVPVDLLSTFFHIFAVNLQQNYYALGDHILFYLISLLTVLLFSIGLNRKQKSLFEALTSFVVVSSIVFISLQLFSSILVPNTVVISVLAFLLQLTPFLFYYKHPYAIWFANACLVLLVFICLNYLSYQVLFVPADVGTTKNILALTLTMSGTLFAFVLRFNRLPEKYRRYSYVSALIGLIVIIPTFTYFLLLESMPTLKSSISLAISLNFGILLFFLSTAIYQWRFSRAIWEAAWGAWLILPIVNYVIIAELLGGIDLATNALSFFGTLGLPGSLILSIIFCTLLYLPLFYTKVKIHFHKILFFIWGETLFLVAWIAQMLFGPNVLLSTGFFGIMAIFLLMPLLYLLKAWKILSYFWIFMITINAVFLYGYLSFLGITLENVLSINLIVVGFFLIILSFFPHLQHRMQLLTISYGIVLTGVFFLIYFAIVAVTLNPFISINISFIILALSLFSSKYLKLNQKNIHFAIAVILISNTSLLVLFSFIFIPGLELFAVFFSLAVFGGSFYVFNWFEMIKPIDSRIPWGIMALGCALAISDLFFVFWQVNVMFLGFTFSLILLIFLFRNLHSYKYALWVFYPVPFTFLIQGFLLPFLGSVLIFGWVATYIALFQITFNIFHRRAKTRTASPQRRYLEILQRSDVAKDVNSVCFLLNSVFIAIIATVASPLSWINQILEFLILWSLFTIISLKYMKTALSEKIGQEFFRYLQGITLLFYIVVPFDVCFNLFDLLLSSGLLISDFITLICLTFSGILFIETYLIDRLWVVAIFPRIRNQLIFWSWFLVGNLYSIQVYLLYGNVFFFFLMLSILNLGSVHFLGSLNIRKKIVASVRYALLNSILVEISLYFASVLTGFEERAIPASLGTPSWIFFFTIFTLTFLCLSLAFRKNLPAKLFQRLNLCLFIGFQTAFALYYIALAMIFDVVNLPVIIFLVFCETWFSFFLVSLRRKGILPAKLDSTQIVGNRILKLSLTLEVSALCFGILLGLVGIFENLLISQFCLLLLSALEVATMQKIDRKYALLLYGISVYGISITLFAFLTTFFNVLGFHYCLILLLFTFTQLYATRVLHHTIEIFHRKEEQHLPEDQRTGSAGPADKFEVSLRKVINNIYSLLMNAIFLVVAVYVTFLVSLIVPLTFLATVPVPVFSAGIFCLIYFLNTLFLNRWLSKRFRTILNLGLFVGFQLLVAISWLLIIDFQSTGMPISLNLLAILETILVMYPVKVMHQRPTRSLQEERNIATFQMNSGQLGTQSTQEERDIATSQVSLEGIIFLLYCELSILVFNVSSLTLSILPTLFLTHLTLFVLSAIDIVVVKRVGGKLIQTIHSISYFNLSLLLFLLLLQFNLAFPAILGLSVFCFITMQFYTNTSMFETLRRFYPNATGKLNLLKSRIQTTIGLCFYGSILFFLQQAISYIDLVGQGVTLSIGLYLLMFIDQRLFKFIVKTTSQGIQAFAWAGFQLFMAIFTWPIVVQFITLLPLFIILNLGGVAYSLKMLDLIESVEARRGKINQILTIASYIALTAWPFFFITMDLVVNLLLCFYSTCLLLALSFLDNYAGAIAERTRKNIRHACFVIVGSVFAGWFTLLISPITEKLFVTFGSALNVCLFLLFLTGILALFLRPFKRHSAQAVICWYSIFSLSGLILFFLTESFLAGIIFIVVFLLAYWVIFVTSVRLILIRFVRTVFKQFRALYFAVKNTLIHTYQKLAAFWHAHFRGIWMTVCAMFGVTVSFLVGTFFSVPISSVVPIGFLIFVLGLYLILTKFVSEKPEEKTFKMEFFYYAALYFTTIWTLISFFPWNVFVLLIAILCFGGVLFFFIDREWKQKRIGYKLRFIVILSFVLLLGLTAFLWIGEQVNLFKIS